MNGTDIVAKSAPDGYSVVSVASSHVLHPSLYRQVPFNTINDFTQVVMLVRSPNLIGTSYIGGTPEQAGAFFRAEMAKWSKVAQAAGLKPE